METTCKFSVPQDTKQTRKQKKMNLSKTIPQPTKLSGIRRSAPCSTGPHDNKKKNKQYLFRIRAGEDKIH